MNDQVSNSPDADMRYRWIRAAITDQRTINLAKKLCFTDADDVLQEAAARAYAKIHDIEGTTYEQVSSFVRRTVSHYSIDIHRSRNRAPIQLGENDSFNERPDLQTASPSNAVRRSDEVSKLYAALEQLDEAERSIFEDKFLAGMKQAEIAAERGCDQATVSRQIDATIAKLRKALGDETFSVLLGR